MKIAALVCGVERCIDLVIENLIETFSHHVVDIITCTGLNDCIQNPHIVKKINVNTLENDSYRNSLNYSYKIQQGIALLEPMYDVYMIIRSDLILMDSLDLDILENDCVYFSEKSLNQFTSHETDKVNDCIIVSKNFHLMKQFIGLYDFAKDKNNYLDILLHQYLKSKNINIAFLDIRFKLILSKCNLIAITGDSGSGKSTLTNVLQLLFDEHSSLVLETDRYHKWERGDTNYSTCSHLNPNANHLEKMYADVYNLKIGHDIYQVDYDHISGRFTQRSNIYSKENIMICGLHTLYGSKINQLMDLKIFINVEKTLLSKWKMKRDVEERGYPLEKVLTTIKEREADYLSHILPQKENANIIINYFEESNGLQCSMSMIKSFGFKILEKIYSQQYDIDMDERFITIVLKNDVTCVPDHIREIFQKNDTTFQKDYMKEIFYLLHLLKESL